MTKDANTSSYFNVLHPAQTVNNIKSHVPLILDLKKVRYEIWAELFRVVARAYLVMDHLDESLPDLDVPTEKWIQIDAIVLSWIYSTISEDLLLTIIKPGSTACDAWLRVKDADLKNQSMAAKLAKIDKEVSDQRLVLQLIKGLTPGL